MTLTFRMSSVALLVAVFASAADSPRYLIQYKGSASDAAGAVARAGGTVLNDLKAIRILVAHSGDSLFEERLAADPAVALTARDERFRLLPLPQGAGTAPAPVSAAITSPFGASQLNRQWHLFTIQANLAWTVTTGRPQVKVAVLDSGICTHQVDLVNKVDAAASTSFVPASEECAELVEPACVGCPSWEDRYYHGSHVAGQISTNNVATAGVAPGIRLRAIKIANCRGESEWNWIVSGILYAAETGNDIANISYSGLVNPNTPVNRSIVTMMGEAIAYARSRGVLVVAAAGNEGRNLDKKARISLPCEAGALCVGATTRSDALADSSNHGENSVPIVAPGGGTPVDPYPLTRDNEYLLGPCSRHSTLFPACGQGTGSFLLSVNGTSMAAGLVSGAAALVESIAPKGPGSYGPGEVQRKLLESTDDLGPGGPDPEFGIGRLNVRRAVQ